MSPARPSQVLALAAVLAMAAPLAPWFLARSTSSEAWTGLLLLLVGVGLAATVDGRAASSLPSSPVATVALALVGGVAVVIGVLVDVRLLQAIGIATTAAALLPVVAPGRATPWAGLMLVVLGLPLAGDIDVVGFPLRRLSAELAARALPVLGVPVAFAETVLVTEHGLADVEAPCAGLSTLRLLLATVAVIAAVRGARPAGLVAASAVAVVVAVVGNATRVTILSFLVLGAHAPDPAALLHVPLGVLVFLAAAAAAVPLLGAATSMPTPSPIRPPSHVAIVAVAVMAALGATGLRATRPGPTAGATTPTRTAIAHGARSLRSRAPCPVPTDNTGDVTLSAAEQELYGRHATAARKRRLRDDAGRDVGEVLFVVTTGLRAIHAPERCLAGNGHAIVDSAVVTRAGLPVKRLVLDGGRATALSLLRSARGGHATDLGDVALARLGLGGSDRDDGPWVFVSAVVASDLIGASDEEVLVARLVDDATDLLVHAAGSPP